MVRHTTLEQFTDHYTKRPRTDERDPALLVPDAVGVVLETAATWLGWDRRPVLRDGNTWTPHKALRRVADHLLDHLTELECRLAGLPSPADHWHGRMVTTDADLAWFTEVDLDEATSRLTRLATCYRARLGGLPADVLDERPDEATWTLREVVHHVAGVAYYAKAMGPLGTPD
ncbi:hypothetical protein Val02_06530 [Virgisporangium aliadipatigenens]|uniref:DinB-like domain-containing protein n=1 Tax=Virgisporangium aliadipatigenens TaxID=741659 RepID=A0A8J4DNR2_9ACTN|nr:hypothetical protein [Virgisporangium aliadipatigenens]GIJ43767.1 hypothetical protein Val02_06530 [Virgisporangium aliadipatigenens]